MLYLLLICVCIEVALITLCVYGAVVRESPVERLDNLFEEEKPQKIKKVRDVKGNFREAFNIFGRQLMSLLALKRYRKSIDKALDKADIPLTAEEMLFAIFISAFLGANIVIILTRNLIPGLITAVAIVFLYLLWIREKTKKRETIMDEQLGDALDMISGCIRTGYSFLMALEVAAEQMPLPISKEFFRVVKEVNLGVNLEDALNNMLERAPIDDLELVITAVVIQRQVGGNLAEILDNISGTIRDRVKLKRELRTATASGRVSGWIVALIPVFIAAILLVIDPGYLKELITNSIGIILLFIAGLDEIIGFFVIRKIIDVRF